MSDPLVGLSAAITDAIMGTLLIASCSSSCGSGSMCPGIYWLTVVLVSVTDTADRLGDPTASVPAALKLMISDKGTMHGHGQCKSPRLNFRELFCVDR